MLSVGRPHTRYPSRQTLWGSRGDGVRRGSSEGFRRRPADLEGARRYAVHSVCCADLWVPTAGEEQEARSTSTYTGQRRHGSRSDACRPAVVVSSVIVMCVGIPIGPLRVEA